MTRVEYLKLNSHKNFAIVDAAMNDLIRPALYDAWMDIVPVMSTTNKTRTYDIVGPVCETGDFLGKDRALDIVDGAVAYLVRQRETFDDLVKGETLLP